MSSGSWSRSPSERRKSFVPPLRPRQGGRARDTTCRCARPRPAYANDGRPQPDRGAGAGGTPEERRLPDRPGALAGGASRSPGGCSALAETLGGNVTPPRPAAPAGDPQSELAVLRSGGSMSSTARTSARRSRSQQRGSARSPERTTARPRQGRARGRAARDRRAEGRARGPASRLRR
jgi:hypothetical protein